MLITRETGNGMYLTLTGVGIIIELIVQSIIKVGADPNDVVLRINDGNCGASINVMFPTPHTFLFDRLHIKDGTLHFVLGGQWIKENIYALPLADPDIIDKIAEIIKRRASKHRKTKSMIKYS